jgi:NADPH:quinone reductase-like Zn-dependent oxidoreductase
MTLPTTMRAVVVENFGGPEVLNMQTVPTPSPEPKHAIIKIKGFGINHAEMHMRRGEWAEAMPIIGIECVGLIASSADPSLPVGTPVAALMGGLGRTINGSYAEYTSAPISNVVKLAKSEVEMGLDWAQAAALPETFATAWTALFRNLEVKEGQRLLVRGGTSSFGRAAIGLASAAGVEVTATTRKMERGDELRALGAKEVILEQRILSQVMADSNMVKFDAILELIGNTTLVDSLKLVRRGGRVCLAGFLGGLDLIADFNPLLQMASGVHFSFFGSFVFGSPEFPLADVPLHEIVQRVANGKVQTKPAKVFEFGEVGVREAHRLMEASQAGGKMVVVMP